MLAAKIKVNILYVTECQHNINKIPLLFWQILFAYEMLELLLISLQENIAVHGDNIHVRRILLHSVLLFF